MYAEIWTGEVSYNETQSIETSSSKVVFSHDHANLMRFVEENINSINSAYSRPRNMLKNYVDEILRVQNEVSNVEWKLNNLRGYLDDAQINYLFGDADNINVIDKTSHNKVHKWKSIPKYRRTHISLCIALGMSLTEIDQYLEMMGYSPLDPMDKNEAVLISKLVKWEVLHPEQIEFKNCYLRGSDSERGTKTLPLDIQEKAVMQMLELKEYERTH